MACFERASPALKQILLKLYSNGERPMNLDHHLHEFGSVEYHIQSSLLEPYHAYLSISTPLLSHRAFSHGLPQYAIETIKGIHPDVINIVYPPRESYQITMRVDFNKIPNGKKESLKIITEISSVQAIIVSYQLKEMLQNIQTQTISRGMYKPMKLVYHPREPFYIIKQSDKVMAVFPIRFKEDTDVIIATAFFQELTAVGSLDKWEEAPPCMWSPIPPPELRGETFEDLSTNGGFVSFEIYPRHVEGKRLDKTVWSLLNFYAFIKHHVKCTRSFIQRRMRSRLQNLVEILQTGRVVEEQQQEKKERGKGCMGQLVSFSKRQILHHRSNFMKKAHSRIKIQAFSQLRRQYSTIPKYRSALRYRKLD
ncbi:actin-related protein 2/3 complex subunit 2B [Impatiens glandulifera]|uniref:actin-related protein 2/3 complex subunit 2B n=1 Tax=Impatiens glandulifera TaxID=253017 RepID=UPI001FB12973|nr:actin-related protein 2/3 complex subunit 2B [Impatiens glandulifera]